MKLFKNECYFEKKKICGGIVPCQSKSIHTNNIEMFM